MLCASLRHGSEEILRRLERPRAAAASGIAVGIPLLHPWANRLSQLSFAAAGRAVEIEAESPLLHYDANALLLHGVPWSRLRWEVDAATRSRVQARLRWHTPAQRAVFPFQHTLHLEVVLDRTSLSFAATLHADADDPVPVSFGFHPYLGLPDTPRAQWMLSLPTMRHLPLDPMGLPDGGEVDVAGEASLLGERSLDDHFALKDDAAGFAIEDQRRRIAVVLLHGYTHAQVYAPRGHDYIALEPMTAPVDALVSGHGLRVVPPGQRFEAQFCIRVES